MGSISIAAILLALLVAPLRAQYLPVYQPPSQFLNVKAKTASTWTHLGSNIVLLQGPVTIEVERATLTANEAVVWIENIPDGEAGEQLISIALLGDAQITQPGITRSGPELIASVHVNGDIRITAETKNTDNLTQSATFQHAQILRLAAESGSQVWLAGATTQPTPPIISATQPTTGPTTRKIAPGSFQLPINLQTTNVEGSIAVVLTGHVAVTTTEKEGQVVEILAERAVIFSGVASLRTAGTSLNGMKLAEQAVTSGYFEGDVRINVTPPPADIATKAPQRLEAERVYYDFTTDRAILTDAVIHTEDLRENVPIIVRAQVIRQLSTNEYRVEHAEMTTSAFAVPSYAIRRRQGIYPRRSNRQSADRQPHLFRRPGCNLQHVRRTRLLASRRRRHLHRTRRALARLRSR